MKNKTFKKSISVFLSVLMILSCWVWTPGEHNQVSAVTKGINLSALSVITDGSGSRADSSKIVICSDGGAGNSTVGILKFNISDIPATITNATLRVNVGNHGGYIPSYANFYLVDPSKCTDATSIGQVINNISSVYKGSYSNDTGANNALSYFGITGSALGTVHQNVTGINRFTITDAVKTARTNGWSQLCLVFIMPKAFSDNGSTGWSDLHIYTYGTTLSCEYPSENAIAGNYYIRYMVNVTSVSNNEKDYNLFVSYKTNNGKGSLVENEVLFDRDSMDYGNADDYVLYEGYINGFPTELWQHMAFPYNTNNERQENFRMYIGSDPDNLTSYSILSTSGNNFTYKNSAQDNHMGVQSLFEPSQSSIVGMSALSISVGKDGKGQSATTIGEVRDQYGVSWYEAPTYTVSSSSTSQSNVSGVSVVTSGAGAYVKVDNLANVTGYNPSTGTATVYLRATSGSASVSVPVTITSPKFNMTFNSPDDATTIAAKQFNYAQPIGTTLPVPTRPGYTFKGWWIDLDGNGVQNGDEGLGDPLASADGTVRSDLQSYPITSDLSLISVWEQNTFDITFNFANGTTNTQTYVPGTTITAPANTTKNPDATNHYTYTWSPTVSTTVTGDATYTEVLEVEAHNWSEWATTSEPTCTAEGAKQRSCNDCGYVETATVGMAAHTEEVIPAVEATCTSTGLTEGKKCSVCDTIIVAQTVVPKKAHTEEIIPAVESTCTKTGLTEGKKCSVCGEILVAQQTTDKKAHAMGDWETVKVPTCITDGSKQRKCANCDYTETVTIPATGNHVYGEWTVNGNNHTRTCTADPLCTESESAAHSFTEDCKQKGTTGFHDYKCSVCSARGVYVDGEPIADRAEECYLNPTISKIDGNNSYHKETCVCGNTRSVEHTPEKVDGTYVAPTCTSKGSQGWKCTVCEYTYTKEIGIDANAHAYGEWIAEAPATCIATGTEGHYTCSLCNKNFDADKNVLADLTIEVNEDAHTHLTVTGAKSATCTTEGNIAYWTCDGCGKIYSDANAKTEITADQTVIGVIAHKWISTAVESELAGFVKKADADCDSKAVYYKNCSACGQSAETIDASQTFEYGDVRKHNWSAWAANGEVTLENKDTTTHSRYCKYDDCDVTETDTHNWSYKETVAPSYTQDGEGTYTCTVCGATVKETIPANKDTTAPTVSIKWEGTTWDELLNTITFGTYVNYNIELEINAEDAETDVAKVEYLVSNTVIDDVTAVTEGWTSYDANNKLTIAKENEANYVVYARVTDNAGNVSYAGTDGFVIDTTKPVITIVPSVNGNADTNVYCGNVTVKAEDKLNVTATLDRLNVPVGSGILVNTPGEHTVVVTDDAGNVSEVTFTVNADHSWNDGVVTKDPTCTEEGVKTYTCTVCNAAEYTEEVAIDANAHTTDKTHVDGYVAPTCTKPGATGDTKYDCCGAVKVASTVIPVDADAHTTEDTHVEGYVAPTCTTPGATGDTKYDCCGAVKVASTVIPVDADAHTTEDTHVEGYVAPTCTTPGATGDTKYDCCGAVKVASTVIPVDADAHTTEDTHVEGYVAPTCTTPGATGDTKYDCCGAVKVASTVIPVDADAHTGTATVIKNQKDATCTAEGYTGDTHWSCCDALETKGTAIPVDADAHTGTATVIKNQKDATCTAEGYTGDTHWSCCDALETKGTAIPIDADAHTGEATVIKNQKDATCTAEGYTGDTHWSCCDALETKGTAIPVDADAHTTDKTHVDGYVAPTCTKPGATGDTKYDCCNAVKVASTEIPVNADAHTGTATVIKNQKDATCTAEGYTGDIHWSCCDALETKGTATPKLAHTPDAAVEENRVEPACDKAGSYESVVYCSVCGTEISRTTVEIPANGEDHKWNLASTKEATCIATGLEVYVCEYCGEEKENVLPIDSDNHKNIVEGVYEEPTCTTPGYTGATVCKDCGKLVGAGTITPAYGHKFSPWTIITMPSEDGKTPGYAERSCPRCGLKETRNDFYGDEVYYVVYHNDNGVRLTAPRYYIEGDYTIRPEKNPTKAQDDKYTYEFIGWDHTEGELNSVHKQMAVVAQYKAIEKSYKVTFRDASGKVIPVEGIAGKDILFSEITKAYNGATPTKAATSDYRYEFMGWNISCDYETGEATVTPEFRQIPIEKEDEDNDGIFGWLIRWIKSILAKIGIVF